MGGYHSNQRISASAASVSASGGDGATAQRPERRVLIAVDGSKGSQRAFDYWAGQPGSEADSIILLNSVEVPNVLTGLLLSPSGTFDYDEYEKQSQLLHRHAQQLRDRLLGECSRRRLRCQFVTESASPGAAIVAAAKRHSASLVVVGCRGNNGIRRSILGSVSDYVLQHSCRPVVVVPEAN